MIIPDRKKLATIIVAKMHSDGGKNSQGHEEAPEDGEHDDHMDGVVAAMSDFLEALDRKSSQDMAEAFMAAFQCAEMMPHEENEEDGDEEVE